MEPIPIWGTIRSLPLRSNLLYHKIGLDANGFFLPGRLEMPCKREARQLTSITAAWGI